ncbi:hypothetical protein J3R82DRAFT_8898 [Butyriboletus roseoflavus]|nr:hypothetical protein J3R82DRAFT_8898 [Butyriboletus roseoflavus]
MTSKGIYLNPNKTWTDLRVHAQRSPFYQRMRKRVLVIGGSVTGLTSAWLLLDLGYDVTIISNCYAPAVPSITGQIAGALWEYPPAVCGQHADQASMEKFKPWSLISRNVFEDLVLGFRDDDHGITLRMANFFFTKRLDHPDMHGQLQKLKEIKKVRIPKYKHDPGLIEYHSVPPEADVIDAYQHEAPVGAVIETLDLPLKGDLFDQEDKLLARYGADAISNATGLCAIELAHDPAVYPVRGSLLHVKNDRKRFPKITKILAQVTSTHMAIPVEVICWLP